MAKKYIVKNCPCIYTGWTILNECFHYNKPCKKCTNCLIKQVIEKCREELGIRYNDIDQGRNYLANDILQLFEIEEVNNDR